MHPSTKVLSKERSFTFTEQDSEYLGIIKVGMVHHKNGSIIYPDILFMGYKYLLWFKPIMFSPNIMGCFGDNSICTISIDINSSHRLLIYFFESDYIETLSDGTQLYKCVIKGPKNLKSYIDGTSEKIGKQVFLHLFHHTTENARESILKSKILFSSQWNIQGTAKFKNIAYGYLTNLKVVSNENDLKKIAMSSDGYIYLSTDDFDDMLSTADNPEILWPNNVVKLIVYRESTYNRKAPIKFLVGVDDLAPSHIYLHNPSTEPTYYEVCHPFIFRIGTIPNDHFKFNKKRCLNRNSLPINLGQITIGEAITTLGLQAPYSEEEDENYGVIEDMTKQPNNTTVFKFWEAKANPNQFSDRDVVFPKFDI